MFFHLKPLILAAIMLLGFELIVYKWEMTFWILGFLFISVAVGTYKVVGKWRAALLPILYFGGSSILLFFVIGGIFLQAYILISIIAYYLILLSAYRISGYKKDETARKINFIMSLGTAFLWSASLLAVYLNGFITFWVVSGTLYVIMLLLTYQLLRTTIQKEGINYWLYSFVVAYCMTILVWGIYFLPFGYLTSGIILLTSYFVMTSYLTQSIQEKFTKVSFITDTLVFLISIGTVLVSARWNILG